MDNAAERAPGRHPGLRAQQHVIAHARYYPRGVPPSGHKYAVMYRGKALTASDTSELVDRLQALMEQE